MSNIQRLSETEGQARMIFLSASPDIPKVDDYQRRVARPLKLSASAPAVRPAAATATSTGPRTMAEAIALEIQAGNGMNAAMAASKKFPHLARAWAAEMEAERV